MMSHRNVRTSAYSDRGGSVLSTREEALFSSYPKVKCGWIIEESLARPHVKVKNRHLIPVGFWVHGLNQPSCGHLFPKKHVANAKRLDRWLACVSIISYRDVQPHVSYKVAEVACYRPPERMLMGCADPPFNLRRGSVLHHQCSSSNKTQNPKWMSHMMIEPSSMSLASVNDGTNLFICNQFCQVERYVSHHYHDDRL